MIMFLYDFSSILYYPDQFFNIDNISSIIKKVVAVVFYAYTPFFLYKQSIFDLHLKNCLSFSKKLPQKIV